MIEPVQKQSCPICASGRGVLFRQIRETSVLRCPECRHQWWNAENLDLKRVYNPDNSEFHSGYDDYLALRPAFQKTFLSRIERLGRLGKGGKGSVLDIGCGPGFFLAEAKRLGWSSKGVEPSEKMARIGIRELGVDIEPGFFQPGMYPDSSFDLITIWDTLEHMQNPLAVLSGCRRMCKADGLIALTTGLSDSLAARICGRYWHLYSIPEHIHFFSRTSLETGARLAGLRVRGFSRDASWYMAHYLFERLGKTVGFGKRLQSWLKGGRWDFIIPLNLFDIGFMVLQPRI